ncbi:hypothetical protein ACFY2Z_26575 [Streptomyces sp. NPDC001222]|uniref:hypothetical protein n=1 Tax=Streptomyces sp. NPDC001222 TaxID=3364548 RepID=UPI0036C023F1
MDRATAIEINRLLDQAETMSWALLSKDDSVTELWDTILQIKVLVSGQVKGRDCGNSDCSQTVVTSATGRPAKYCSDACRFRAAYLRRH